MERQSVKAFICALLPPAAPLCGSVRAKGRVAISEEYQHLLDWGEEEVIQQPSSGRGFQTAQRAELRGLITGLAVNLNSVSRTIDETPDEPAQTLQK